MQHCCICKEAKPYECKPIDPKKFKCKRCAQSAENYYFAMDFANPGSVPAHLPQLTFMEEQLIARVEVNQYVYFRRSDTIASKGHCINFQQDPTEIANELPKLAKDISVVVIRKQNLNGVCQELKVRRYAVQKWLYWLKDNHPQYKNLNISKENLARLPEDGELTEVRTLETSHEPDYATFNSYNHLDTKPMPEELIKSEQMDVEENPLTSDQVDELSQKMLKSCSVTSNLNEINKKKNSENDTDFNTDDLVDDEDDDTHTGVPCPVSKEMSETDRIQEFINKVKGPLPKFNYPTSKPDPLNEYTTVDLASMAFPCLFPYGKADPFGIHSRHAEVSFLLKVRHLFNYMEVINGENVFRFARHTRFVLWIANIGYRHAVMDQGDVYLKQNPEDSNLTVEDLKILIENPVGLRELLKNMNRYTANIPGTGPYWMSALKDLESIIQCLGGPHLYFTFTYANDHDPDLHRYLNIKPGSSAKHIKHVMNNNPHIVNWFFTKKFHEYQKEFLQESLNGSTDYGGWIWFRYEWQHRKIIHCHGLLRMGNAPDTYELNDKCLEGFRASLKEEDEQTAEDRELIRIGKAAEVELVQFYDSLICCDAEMRYDEWQQCKPTKLADLPVKIRRIDLGPEMSPDGLINLWKKDQLDLTLLLQYHKCRVGSCIKIYKNVMQPCKNKHPKPISAETAIIYKRYKFKDSDEYGPYEMEIVPKRVNNTRVTNHNPDTLVHWRANHDFSLVHDYRRVKKYVTKYTTKPEKKSNAFKALFSEILGKVAPNNANTALVLKKIMNKVLGERDISNHEALHQISALPLKESNISVVKVNLDHSKQIRFQKGKKKIN